MIESYCFLTIHHIHFLVVIQAIRLLTAKFDQNLLYRQQLIKNEGDRQTALDFKLGIISTTVPAVSGEYDVSPFQLCYFKHRQENLEKNIGKMQLEYFELVDRCSFKRL